MDKFECAIKQMQIWKKCVLKNIFAIVKVIQTYTFQGNLIEMGKKKEEYLRNFS